MKYFLVLVMTLLSFGISANNNEAVVEVSYGEMTAEQREWVDEVRQDVLFEIHGNMETLSTKELLKVMNKPIITCQGVGMTKCGDSYAYQKIEGRYIDFMLYPENIKIYKTIE